MTPDKFTNQEFFLDVGDGHQLYVYDWGKSDARLPIIFLHGGPGNSINDRYKQRFVPQKQRLIFFDQRGAGRSLPKGSLEHNTTDDLVEDIQKLVQHLKLKRFVITGGSWGSTLALAFALKHPDNIEAMVLGGIWTGAKKESDHLMKGGFRAYFPEVWEQYVARTPKEFAADPSDFHLKNAFNNDSSEAKKSVYAIGELEHALLSLDDRYSAGIYDEFEPDDMRIEVHYLKNDCFMPNNYILDNAHKIKMPIWLVQGRYDMVCPPVTAYELNKKLPRGELIWTTAGHANDRPNYDVARTLLLQIGGNE